LNMSVLNNELIIERHNLGLTSGMIEWYDDPYRPINYLILGNYYYLMFTRVCIILSYISHMATVYSIYFNWSTNIIVILNLILLILIMQSVNNIGYFIISNDSSLGIILLVFQIFILRERDVTHEPLLNDK
jgi:hypothetical protein